MSNSQLAKGYKRTEVGLIPEDWEVICIGDFCTCFSGGTPNTSNAAYYGGAIPWITSSDLNQTRILEVNGRITEEGLTHSSAKIVKPQTLLLALYGATAGISAITEIRAAINQAILAIQPMQDNPEYLSQYLQLRKDYFIKTYTQGGQPNFSGEIVKAFIIPLPPTKAEQEAIADALSDTDALIESLKQLITKKRQLKQGAMQELLTGKRRLPGFSGAWDMKTFAEICWFQEGPGVRNTQFTSSGIKLLNGTNIFQGVLNLDTTNRFISQKEAFGSYSHFLADAGDIVIASSGITVEKFHDKVAFVRNKDLPFCLNTSTIRFKPLENILQSNYLFQFLRSNKFKHMIGGQATGSAQLNFGPSHVAKVTISLPPLSEQTAIAAILSDIDTEITALETKLSKTRQIKQGMMHELLTGRIRLI